MTLKHTAFMQTIARTIGDHLPAALQNFHLGEKRWFCQVYFGRDRRLHYEVNRPWSRNGRQLEIGLHFESHNRNLNRQLLLELDKHLVEIQDKLGREVKAEQWDRGWTKVYETYPDEELTEALAETTTTRFAEFITILQPIYLSVAKEFEHE